MRCRPASLAEQTSAGVLLQKIGVFVRSELLLDQAQAFVLGTDLPFRMVDEHIETARGDVSPVAMRLRLAPSPCAQIVDARERRCSPFTSLWRPPAPLLDTNAWPRRNRDVTKPHHRQGLVKSNV